MLDSRTLKIVCVALGVFEFLAVWSLVQTPASEVLKKQQYTLPAILLTDVNSKIVFCGYLLTLGLQRLTFGLTSTENIATLSCLIITHVIECVIWFSLAYNNIFLINTETSDGTDAVKAFFLNIAQFKYGMHPFIVLVGVPILTSLFIASAISITSAAQRKKVKSLKR